MQGEMKTIRHQRPEHDHLVSVAGRMVCFRRNVKASLADPREAAEQNLRFGNSVSARNTTLQSHILGPHKPVVFRGNTGTAAVRRFARLDRGYVERCRLREQYSGE